jgi:hypothetical protein
MAHDDRRAIIRAYDRIAGEYLDRFGAPPPGGLGGHRTDLDQETLQRRANDGASGEGRAEILLKNLVHGAPVRNVS